MPWPLVARRAVDRVVELLQAGPATGVALIGNEGVGKTTLAAQSAERLGRGEPLGVRHHGPIHGPVQGPSARCWASTTSINRPR